MQHSNEQHYLCPNCHTTDVSTLARVDGDPIRLDSSGKLDPYSTSAMHGGADYVCTLCAMELPDLDYAWVTRQTIRKAVSNTDGSIRAFKDTYDRQAHFDERILQHTMQEPLIRESDLKVITDEYMRYSDSNPFRKQRFEQRRINKKDIQHILRSIDKRNGVCKQRKKALTGHNTLTELMRLKQNSVKGTYLERLPLQLREKIYELADYNKPKPTRISEKTKQPIVICYTKLYLERWQSIAAILRGESDEQFPPDLCEGLDEVGAIFMAMSHIWKEWQNPWYKAERHKYWRYPERKYVRNISEYLDLQLLLSTSFLSLRVVLATQNTV